MDAVPPAPETLQPLDSRPVDPVDDPALDSRPLDSRPLDSRPLRAHRIDVHQHLWPGELLEALRARREAPRLDGWTLILGGEPAYDVRPADHDADRRRAQDGDRIVLGLSSPLGIEDLPFADGAPLLQAWHQGVARLAGQFEAWASVSHAEPD
ncbi:MAG TPA: hypothetical protein VIJ15_11720, partial [Dermatophilaceae bacterium]